MADPGSKDVTELLLIWGSGDRSVQSDLFPLVYDELKRLASRRLRREGSPHTLQTTGLVHEAYIRLIDQRRAQWQNRSHFFAIAAETMRRVLVDYARRKRQLKRGGEVIHVSLDDVEPAGPDRPDAAASEVLALDAALTKLSGIDPQKGRLIELRFFGGLSIEETADVLAVSPGTVMRDWTLAKAWLRREMVALRDA